MMKLIKSILLNIINNIDAGNSNLTEKECIEILDYLATATNKKEKLSKYQAVNILE